MSQRVSGYQRPAGDRYMTPARVTKALLPHLPTACHIWEPAAGTGIVVEALEAAGHGVTATDIMTGHDFRTTQLPTGARGIVTNPPYSHATDFVERALALLPPNGFAAFLPRCDFDSAGTRRHLFGENPAFAKKLILAKRIRWIAESTGSPSFNHAWFIWDRAHEGAAVLSYGGAKHAYEPARPSSRQKGASAAAAEALA
jgi:hypothetical protein